MSRTSASNVIFVTPGIDKPVTYFKKDLIKLLEQSTAHGLRPVSVKATLVTFGVSKEITTTAMIAVNRSGNRLKQSSHEVALPCPDFCGKDNEEVGPKPTADD